MRQASESATKGLAQACADTDLASSDQMPFGRAADGPNLRECRPTPHLGFDAARQQDRPSALAGHQTPGVVAFAGAVKLTR
jgi:hypothetical protein